VSVITWAPTGTVRKFVDRLKELHESGDESARKTVGTALLTGFKLSHDQLQGYMKELVPLIFMVSVCILGEFCRTSCHSVFPTGPSRRRRILA
jgi:hypothetical protein